MGFFSGLSGLWSTPPLATPPKPWLPYNLQFIGHVLDVILDENHPKYDPDKNRTIGTIFWRDALSTYGSGQTQFDEVGGGRHANPIDRSNFKVPLPGEQVVVFRAKSSKLDGPDIFLSSQFFYGQVVGMTPNNTINSSPFIGVDPDLLNPFLPGAFTVSQLAKRFDKKIKNIAAFKERKKPIVHKQLQLNEGDFILQGRFGGSIRFAGTPIGSEKRGQKWAEGDKGLAGDPIMLMRVNGARGSFDDLEGTLYEREDLDEDAASIYMTTTQQIQVDLAVPEKGGKAHPLATWAYDIGIEGFLTDGEQSSNAARDGEEARTGSDQSTPKVAENSQETKDNTTAPTADNNSDASDNGAQNNSETGGSGFDGLFNTGQSGNNP